MRWGVALASSGLIWPLAGCSEEGTPTPAPPSTAPGASDTAEPGPEIEGEAASFQAPAGFAPGEPTEESPATFATGPAGAVISLVEVELAGQPPLLDRQQEIALDRLGPKYSSETTVPVDGVEMWHLSGREPGDEMVDVYGTVLDGTSVRLTIRLADAEYDEAERAAVNEQVLASWSWA